MEYIADFSTTGKMVRLLKDKGKYVIETLHGINTEREIYRDGRKAFLVFRDKYLWSKNNDGVYAVGAISRSLVPLLMASRHS